MSAFTPKRRLVSIGLFLNEDLADAEAETGLPLRLAYIGIWLVTDHTGHFPANPRRLRATIFPYDPELDFEAILVALGDYGLVEYGRYTDEQGRTKTIGRIPSFKKHQRLDGREQSYGFPTSYETLSGYSAEFPGNSRKFPEVPGNSLIRLDKIRLDKIRKNMSDSPPANPTPEGPVEAEDEIEPQETGTDLVQVTPVALDSYACVPTKSKRYGVDEVVEAASLVLAEFDNVFAERQATTAQRFEAVTVVFAYWAKKAGKTKRTKLDYQRGRMIAARWDESLDLSELLYAVDGAFTHPDFTGATSETGTTYQEIDNIFRNRARVEKLANACSGYRAGTTHPLIVKAQARKEATTDA